MRETTDMHHLVDLIQNGWVVIYPTDTIWGIGADATDESAVRKSYEVKYRPAEKSMIVLFSSYEMGENYGIRLSHQQQAMIENAHKPTTLILTNVKWLAPNVYHADGSIGVRFLEPMKHISPSAQRCFDFVEELGKPIISTSANRSGKWSPSSFSDIDHDLLADVDGYLSWKLLDAVGEPSSVVRIDTDGKVSILRA